MDPVSPVRLAALAEQMATKVAGQDRAVAAIMDSLAAMGGTRPPASPVLLPGPPGVGKTELAMAVAERLGTDVVRIDAGAIAAGDELARAFSWGAGMAAPDARGGRFALHADAFAAGVSLNHRPPFGQTVAEAIGPESAAQLRALRGELAEEAASARPAWAHAEPGTRDAAAFDSLRWIAAPDDIRGSIPVHRDPEIARHIANTGRAPGW